LLYCGTSWDNLSWKVVFPLSRDTKRFVLAKCLFEVQNPVAADIANKGLAEIINNFFRQGYRYVKQFPSVFALPFQTLLFLFVFTELNLDILYFVMSAIYTLIVGHIFTLYLIRLSIVSLKVIAVFPLKVMAWFNISTQD